MAETETRAGRVAGKTILVTGALSGIGRAVARLLAQEGASVIAMDKAEASRDDARPAREVVAELGGGARFILGDVTSPNDVERTFNEVGEIDVLVNNAGVTVFKPLVDFGCDDFDQVMAVNVRGVFLMTRGAVRCWLDRGRTGVVVNVASNLGLVGTPSGSVYCASKGAVIAFTKAVAAEIGPRGIRVNALCPGATATEFNRAFRAESGVLEAWEASTPLRLPGRDFLAMPDQIAPAVVFLASDESDYMTGAELVVDGGWNCE